MRNSQPHALILSTLAASLLLAGCATPDAIRSWTSWYRKRWRAARA